MSKIDYSLIGIDEEGQTVLDLPMSADEVIGILTRHLNRAGDASCPDKTVHEAGESGPVRRGRPKKEARVSAPTPANGDVRPCCGSNPRGRHRAGCPQAPSAQPGGRPHPGRHTVDGRHPFSEKTYDKVKKMREDGESIDYIVSETGLDPVEVRRADLADDYNDYLAIT